MAEPVALSYDEYLHLDDLLALQRPLAEPPAHDELMFIMVHQVYQLWFRLLLPELTAARDAMIVGEVHRPRLLLTRCHAIERPLWRGRHALLVERQIGAKTGTGGSTGVRYLRSREHDQFFPELWEVRSQL
jgi:tryptophan 2,3-dioxygenase